MRPPKGRTIRPPNLPDVVISRESCSENGNSLIIQEIRNLGSILREMLNILKSESVVKKRG